MVTRTKKIFVGGLSAPTTLEDVKNYFEQFGPVSHANFIFYLLRADEKKMYVITLFSYKSARKWRSKLSRRPRYKAAKTVGPRRLGGRFRTQGIRKAIVRERSRF